MDSHSGSRIYTYVAVFLLLTGSAHGTPNKRQRQLASALLGGLVHEPRRLLHSFHSSTNFLTPLGLGVVAPAVTATSTMA